MKISWNDMNRREKVMVAGAGALILILFSYMIVLKPVHDEYARLKVEVPVKRADLQWMRSVAAENNNAFTGIRNNGGSSSLLKKIDQTARQHKISENLARVEPVGDSGVKLWFENVLYTDFLGWLRSLSLQNMFSASSLSVEKTEADGRVTVRLSLEKR